MELHAVSAMNIAPAHSPRHAAINVGFYSSAVVKYFIPSFGGQSYLAFQTMSAYHTVRIAMEFRASDMTGILLYNGQNGKKDFICLALVNGRVELR